MLAWTCVHSRVPGHVCVGSRAVREPLLPLLFHLCPVLLDKDTDTPRLWASPLASLQVRIASLPSGQSQVRTASLPSCSLRSSGDTVSLSTQAAFTSQRSSLLWSLTSLTVVLGRVQAQMLPPFSDGETESQQSDAVIDWQDRNPVSSSHAVSARALC